MLLASRHTYQPTGRTWLSLLICGIIAGVGLFEMSKGAAVLLDAAQSRHWPTVPGNILQSSLPSQPNRQHPSLTPVVTFSYVVDGCPYTGNTIAPGLGVQNRDISRTFLDKYPAGAVCTVAYEPANPAHTCLEPGVHVYSFLHLLLGMVGFCFGAQPIAESYLIPKYGKHKPNSTTYTLSGSHPVAKALNLLMLAVVVSFLALMFLCWRGYVIEF